MSMARSQPFRASLDRSHARLQTPRQARRPSISRSPGPSWLAGSTTRAPLSSVFILTTKSKLRGEEEIQQRHAFVVLATCPDHRNLSALENFHPGLIGPGATSAIRFGRSLLVQPEVLKVFAHGRKEFSCCYRLDAKIITASAWSSAWEMSHVRRTAYWSNSRGRRVGGPHSQTSAPILVNP